ncbi:MAG: SpoIID/LytB domain-containing protein [Bacteroidia bacterium]|nr:SpoIID/LytB domain-containing protein [Bacteroidia bacterium]
MKRTILSFLLFFFTTQWICAHKFVGIGLSNVKVSVFNSSHIKTVLIAPLQGAYTVVCDGVKLYQVSPEFVIQLNCVNDSIDVKTGDQKSTRAKCVDITGMQGTNVFKVKLVNPDAAIKQYDDNLQVHVANGELKLVNETNLDTYVSNVVTAEVGTQATLEYYKAQSIICRTYALGHLRRHEQEGFNLCDQVHCQVTNGTAKVTPLIREATLFTKGLVMVDEKQQLVLAAFHSNCGGQTVNCEEVWSMKKSYLRSKTDNYCKTSKQANWEKKIPLTEWNAYFCNKYNITELDKLALLGAYTQETRKVYYSNSPAILLKNIRTDFKLKSTLFDVSNDGVNVYVRGHGYGHGVGLCQEGAINMAKQGIDYKTVLNFYFLNIAIIDLDLLNFDKQ